MTCVIDAIPVIDAVPIIDAVPVTTHGVSGVHVPVLYVVHVLYTYPVIYGHPPGFSGVPGVHANNSLPSQEMRLAPDEMSTLTEKEFIKLYGLERGSQLWNDAPYQYHALL